MPPPPMHVPCGVIAGGFSRLISEPEVRQLFAAAIQHHQQGRLLDAECLYRQVLAGDPGHVDSLYRLGLLCGQTGRHAFAADMFGQAIEINPSEPSYHCNRGIALQQQGRLAEAIACFAAALDRKPDYAEAHNNLGMALWAQGRPEAAIDCYRKTLVLEPGHVGAHNNLGNALRQQGLLDAAAICYRRAIDLDPQAPGLHNNLGTVLKQQGRLEEASASFRRAIARDPDYPTVHNNLGTALLRQGHLNAAIASFRRALELLPAFPEAHNNLGVALGEQALQDAAIDCYRRAIDLQPDFAEAHNNLGTAFRARQRLDAALASYRRAIEISADYAEAHNNLGMALLAQGDMAPGWQEYEWRWQVPDGRQSRRGFIQPQWRGEPAGGQTLLIHAEQGLGDSLQFCRYAPLAAAKGLRVILEVPAPLVRLMGSVPGVERVVQSGDVLPDFDLHCPMLSMPLALRTTIATVPDAIPYLHADAVNVDHWRARLDAARCPGRRVGLAWAGSSRSHSPTGAALDRRRSIAPERLAPLFQPSGLHFVSLQKDGPTAPTNFPLTDLMGEVTDFADTAALVANLDLVISVDTSVAHLAAALGKPVWLLDRFDCCWRWMTDRRDSPWYPTLRLFRQPEPGNWDTVIACVQAELGAFAGDPASLPDAVRHHQGSA